ncbi:MAG TPA: hypothetical protein PKI00_02635 [Candidatus Pacearchaeota archaeon]|nr:hypothetical protein [Candidatus Parcubacteria bacterium]HNP79721.1 hypothetical protein [Candidatus Pacearchaeota archaeon]HOC53865.1 hypothetical protein [Candidatus Pacearchaeota archaeon]HQM24582.1 hypothetical protein [Candidatus Pacearchaeota archaeon]
MNKKVLYIILFILLIGSVIFYLYATTRTSEPIDYDELVVSTDKEEYSANEKAIINIKNVSDKRACFSSCYPFYVQTQDQDKKFYQYEECPFEDIVSVCVDPHQDKYFEIDLGEQIIPKSNSSYAFVISACLTCDTGDTFKRDDFFFSNKFIVK